MNNMNFELTKDQIEELGFSYEPNPNICREHMWNWVPLKMDLRLVPEYELKNVENDVNDFVLELIRQDIEEANILAIHSVKFSRLFRIGDLFNPRQFTALFNVRIMSVDKPTGEPGNHVIRS